MAGLTELMEGVRKSLSPEITSLADRDLAEKIAEAYATALSETDITSLDDMSCSGMIGGLHIPGLTQSDHLRGVGRLAFVMAKEVRELYGTTLDIDPDIALAAGLLHDLGKPFFYDSSNIRHWEKNKLYTGRPPFRHTLYGAHIAMQVGLPIEIAHVIAGHDIRMDGQYVDPSIYLKIVAHADDLFWIVPKRFEMFEKDPTDVPGPGA